MADACLERLEPSWLVGGILDEPAHLATAVLVLANLPATGPAWRAGYAVGAVAVDADHLPLVPIRHTLRKETPRPPAHTLFVPVALALAARLTRAHAREILLGAAAGTCIHFLRDLGTGTGLVPVQPLVRWRTKAPSKAYELAMALLTARAWRLPR